jgi:hypothetical protein
MKEIQTNEWTSRDFDNLQMIVSTQNELATLRKLLAILKSKAL